MPASSASTTSTAASASGPSNENKSSNSSNGSNGVISSSSSSKEKAASPSVVPVYYHIPADSDDPDHPNVFTLAQPPSSASSSSTSSMITLKQLKRKFPLPGSYHFRFKVPYKSSHIWIDITNDNSTIPLFNSKIVAKVLRIDWNNAICRQPLSSLSASSSTFHSNSTNDMLTDKHRRHGFNSSCSSSHIKTDIKSIDGEEQDMLLFDAPARTGNVTNGSAGGGGSGDNDLDMLFG